MNFEPETFGPASHPVGGRITPEKRDITPVMIDLLKGTRPWVLFIAVMGFIGTAFMALAGVGMLIGGAVTAAMGSGKGPLGGWEMALLSLIYLVLAVPYFLGSLHLTRYASSIQRLVQGGGSVELEDALAHQRSFWKLVGISFIAMFVLYGLVLVGMVVAGVANAL